mgnify:CR=1 FL=1
MLFNPATGKFDKAPTQDFGAPSLAPSIGVTPQLPTFAFGNLPSATSAPVIVGGVALPQFSATSAKKVVSSSAPAVVREGEVKKDAVKLTSNIQQAKGLLTAGYDQTTGMPIGWTPQATSPAPQTPFTPADTSEISNANGWIDQGNGVWKNVNTGEIKSKEAPATPQTPDEVAKAQASLAEANRKLGIFTPEEQAGFKQAGVAAGGVYDQSIIEAMQSKYYGMPEAVQAGLRAGGAMNTQIAGASAAPGQEGLNVGSFIGRGGELEKISSAYDFNIAKLEAAKNAAIQQAEVAARTASQTGKKEDRDAAVKALANAKSAAVEQQKLTEQKTQNLTKLTQQKQEQSYEQVSDLLDKFGSGAFEGMDAAEISQLEADADLPAGTLSRGQKTLKEIEDAGGELNLKEVDGSLYNVYQDEDGNVQTDLIVKGKPKGGGRGGLTPAQINSTVNSIAGAFDNEPITKNYNLTQQGFRAISSIGVNTKNPADDIAFIYAFAKIMDPESVVREGEYKTIQIYAQSWAQAFGFKAKRLFSNTNFLSSDAKQKMLAALAPKVSAIENQYLNLKSEYQRQMNDAYAGVPRTLTSYEGGGATGTSQQVEYEGKIYNVDENGEMTPV